MLGDEEHEYKHATDRDEPPELEDGECIVDMELFRDGTLRSKILLSRWRYTSVKQAAGWYLGDQLKKSIAKDNKPWLYMMWYEHESKPQGDPEVHTALGLASYGSKRLLIADSE